MYRATQHLDSYILLTSKQKFPRLVGRYCSYLLPTQTLSTFNLMSTEYRNQGDVSPCSYMYGCYKYGLTSPVYVLMSSMPDVIHQHMFGKGPESVPSLNYSNKTNYCHYEDRSNTCKFARHLAAMPGREVLPPAVRVDDFCVRGKCLGLARWDGCHPVFILIE